MSIHSEYSSFSGRGSLSAVVNELKRQKETKVDFVADTRQMTVGESEGRLKLYPSSDHDHIQIREFLDSSGIDITEQTLVQIGQKSSPDIPSKFLKKLADQKPALASSLLNGMFDDGSKRLVRCLDNKVRAFLSDRYRVLDNYDLAFQALEAVQAAGGEVLEAQLTDRHMRLKFTTRSIWDVIDEKRSSAPSSSWYAGGMGNQSHLSRVAARTEGDLPGGEGTVHPLVTISNSETGHCGLSVRMGILRAICFNLATVEHTVKQIHLGSRMEAGVFEADTVEADSKAIWLKCRDAISKSFHPASFDRIVKMAQNANSHQIDMPTVAVDHIVESTTLSQDSRDSSLITTRRLTGSHRLSQEHPRMLTTLTSPQRWKMWLGI